MLKKKALVLILGIALCGAAILNIQTETPQKIELKAKKGDV